jgi:hypothetical protein
MRRRLKTFRLPSQPTQPLAERPAEDYSAEECASFREAFEPLAKRYRQERLLAYVFLACAVGCIVLSIVLPDHPLLWPISAATVCFLGALFFAGLRPWLACPACQNALDQEIGDYCPECGAKAVTAAESGGFAQCGSCHRRLNSGRFRRYSIRACTHCGVALDHRGL